MPTTMRAVVIHAPGGPEVLRLEERLQPVPGPDDVLIRVRAFGLNRSELFTRQGHSPNVRFPRVLGIEAVGTVAAAPGGSFRVGDTVATVMGGMGRAYDGGYADYTVVPARQVRSVQTKLSWAELGALPEMLQTAWGALHRTLHLAPGDRLLIRGGTTSVGLAAAAIAKMTGADVMATSRRAESEARVRGCGADHFVIDSGTITDAVQRTWPEGADKVLELVGTTTLEDSLRSVREGGVVCMAGMVGDAWTLDHFAPMDTIPTGVALTTYSGNVSDFLAMPLQPLVDAVEDGRLPVSIGHVFPMVEIVAAHRLMESNGAGGMIVVVTEPADAEACRPT